MKQLGRRFSKSLIWGLGAARLSIYGLTKSTNSRDTAIHSERRIWPTRIRTKFGRGHLDRLLKCCAEFENPCSNGFRATTAQSLFGLKLSLTLETVRQWESGTREMRLHNKTNKTSIWNTTNKTNLWKIYQIKKSKKCPNLSLCSLKIFDKLSLRETWLKIWDSMDGTWDCWSETLVMGLDTVDLWDSPWVKVGQLLRLVNLRL